jgi:acetyl-CoA acyltransferase
MTRAPFVMPKPGAAVVAPERMFTTRPSAGASSIRRCEEAYGTDSMPQTADNVAEDFGISRADQDAFALRSQARGKGRCGRRVRR